MSVAGILLVLSVVASYPVLNAVTHPSAVWHVSFVHFVERAAGTLDQVRVTSAKFGPCAGNMKFNTQIEERMCIRIIIQVCV